MDSNISDGLRNATGRKPNEKHILPIIIADGTKDEKKFYSTKAMASQSSELMGVLHLLPGAKVKVYGDTLMAAIVKEGKKRGRKECYEPGEDFFGTRLAASFSLYGGPIIDNQAGKETDIDHPPVDKPTPDIEGVAAGGSDGVHVHEVSPASTDGLPWEEPVHGPGHDSQRGHQRAAGH